MYQATHTVHAGSFGVFIHIQYPSILGKCMFANLPTHETVITLTDISFPKKLHEIFHFLFLLHILSCNTPIFTYAQWHNLILCDADTIKSDKIKCIIPVFFFLFLSLNYREEAVAPKTEKKKNERLNQASKLGRTNLVWWTTHDSHRLIRIVTNDTEEERMACYLKNSHIASSI